MIKEKTDVLKIINRFHQDLESQPSFDKMYKEVRMMNFKMRPIGGDVATLTSLKSTELVAILWKIGKLDEFYFQEAKKLSLNNRLIFNNFFLSMQEQLQQQLNKLKFTLERSQNFSTFFEMEIVKEKKYNKAN